MHSVTRTGETFKPRRFNIKREIKNLGVTSGEPVKVASYSAAKPPTSSPSAPGTTPRKWPPAR
jgi:hypothetical protein